MSVLADERFTDEEGRIIPGSLAHLNEVADPCKIDGCTNPSAGKGGSWVGLCAAHISEEGRRRQSFRKPRPPVPPPCPGREKLYQPGRARRGRRASERRGHCCPRQTRNRDPGVTRRTGGSVSRNRGYITALGRS